MTHCLCSGTRIIFKQAEVQLAYTPLIDCVLGRRKTIWKDEEGLVEDHSEYSTYKLKTERGQQQKHRGVGRLHNETPPGVTDSCFAPSTGQENTSWGRVLQKIETSISFNPEIDRCLTDSSFEQIGAYMPAPKELTTANGWLCRLVTHSVCFLFMCFAL